MSSPLLIVVAETTLIQSYRLLPFAQGDDGGRNLDAAAVHIMTLLMPITSELTAVITHHDQSLSPQASQLTIMINLCIRHFLAAIKSSSSSFSGSRHNLQ